MCRLRPRLLAGDTAIWATVPASNGIRFLSTTMLLLSLRTVPASMVSRTWRRWVKKSDPVLYSADEDKKGIATDLVQGLNRAYEELARHLERK